MHMMTPPCGFFLKDTIQKMQAFFSVDSSFKHILALSLQGVIFIGGQTEALNVMIQTRIIYNRCFAKGQEPLFILTDLGE